MSNNSTELKRRRKKEVLSVNGDEKKEVKSSSLKEALDDSDSSGNPTNSVVVAEDVKLEKPTKNEFTGNDESRENHKIDEEKSEENSEFFVISVKFDLVAFLLFAVAFATRTYKLSTPNNIVFDELHYGKYVSLYMRNTFFFDQHPPLGKQLISAVAYLRGYDGNYTFSRIGATYGENVPIFWLRFIPALCGSALSPAVYYLLLQSNLHRWTALLGGVLVILDNCLLTQSRFILMESILLLFSTIAIYFLLKFQSKKFLSFSWLINGVFAAIFCTFAVSVKYAGFYTCCLAFFIVCRSLWKLLPDKSISNFHIICQTFLRILIFSTIPLVIYLTIFYIHLNILHKAGPHDNVMTSAFQASLDGGLASITKGQPLNVVHGSQITLRHSLGRTCWLHSHFHVYPIRYSDKRGSSHQQQVTCYSFKDVNNWWIVKRPERDDLVVAEEPDPIKHGDEIQLVHGITSRALNSHDVAAPVSPHSQEVSCYIDYNVSMPGQLLWRVDIINKDSEGPIWHTIRSQIRLIHVTTGYALRFSGKQLPEWGFNQHEVVADKVINQQDTIWNVEEHRYTKTENQKERERQLLKAEMIPTRPTSLSFWEKFVELQSKMLWYAENLQSHMYSSEPFDWPLMSKGIAYWVDKDSNAQIYLLGNVLIWYSGSAAIFTYISLFIFYLLRRRRKCYDIPQHVYHQFQTTGEVFFVGYLIHYLPYFFVDRILFLHNYIPAFLFKIFILCFVIEHIYKIVERKYVLRLLFKLVVCIWIASIVLIFKKFLVLSYGETKLNADQLSALRWKDTWDFIFHKDLS